MTVDTIKRYYFGILDKAVEAAGAAAALSIGVETADANALAFDFKLMLGMALGGALISVLTTIAKRGLDGRE